jgi:hypothetical protein
MLRKMRKGGDHGQEGGGHVQTHLGLAGNDRLLEEELQAVGDGLKHPERAGPHRSEAVLEVRHHLALRPHVDDGE